ncbi:dihydrofolate reductase family protein [Ornithinimicrobium sp. Y1847]|uniref:dihydrofolate reductase family protein n=1 Tax=Ornithinimicrobium sp. Y1847 TaxID=3405419 RepID=UPI003B67114E
MTGHLKLNRLADLSTEDLRAMYAPLRKPWLRVNFVSTLDGAAQGGDGLSKSINNDADQRVFRALRAHADCLVVGAGTLRAERYQHPTLPLVVVTRSGEVPDSLVDAPDGSVLMATVASAPGLDAARELLGEERVMVLGEREIDLPALKSTLAERGWVDQLCEGGPHLFGALAAAGVVDELCLTLVPRLIGGDHLRVLAGHGVNLDLRPRLLLEQDGTLLGSWLVASPAG